MKHDPTIAACLIVKDAVRTIEAALSSVRPHVDEINIYDTGSSDGTLELVAELQADGADGGGAIRIERGEWLDDFGWAREQSFGMASPEVDWIVWLDSDDVVSGGEHLRLLARRAPEGFGGYAMLYEYEHDESGLTVVQTWRARLVRRTPELHWEGCVHELLVPDGPVGRVDPQRIRWVHRAPTYDRWHPDRNLRLLRAEEARCANKGREVPMRSQYYLGAELAWIGAFEEAARYFQDYASRIPSKWTDEHVHILHRLTTCLRLSGRIEDALALQLEAEEHRPDWPETAAGLTESYAALGRNEEVERWATQALARGPVESPLVERPLEMTVLPALRLVQARIARGDVAAALADLDRMSDELAHIVGLQKACEELRSRLGAGDINAAMRIIRETAARFDLDLKAFARGLHLSQARKTIRDAPAPEADRDVLVALGERLQVKRSLADEVRRARTDLRAAYEDYTSTVSSSSFALSLETASLVLALCRSTGPRSVIDLGSGFTSYLLRLYAMEHEDVAVCSVDDSRPWLRRTEEFLRRQGLPVGEVISWDEFSSRDPAEADLVIHDLGDMLTRRQTLPMALASVASSGLVVIDDVDRSAYATYVRDELACLGFTRYDVSRATVDAIDRFCWIAVAPTPGERPPTDHANHRVSARPVTAR